MRIAGAQRAHDHVVLLGRVLDHHHMLALAAGIVEFGDRRGRILHQPGAIGRIAPGLGYHADAVARSDLLLIEVDQEIEGRWINIAFLGQDRFQRTHAQFGLRQLGMVVIVVVMVVVIVIMVAHGLRIGAKSGLCRGRDSASICRWGSGQGAR